MIMLVEMEDQKMFKMVQLIIIGINEREVVTEILRVMERGTIKSENLIIEMEVIKRWITTIITTIRVLVDREKMEETGPAVDEIITTGMTIIGVV